MTAALFIVRHGDTFEKGEPLRRIGARTDRPLTEAGREQARRLGAHFAAEKTAFSAAYCSTLRRTRETAELVLAAMKSEIEIETMPFLTEIDYGVDENQPEDVVRARIGADALRRWEEEDAPPPGWRVDPEGLVRQWMEFFAAQEMAGPHCALVVTSAGIARFALHAARRCGGEAPRGQGKLATGAYGRIDISRKSNEAEVTAQLRCWNVRP